MTELRFIAKLLMSKNHVELILVEISYNVRCSHDMYSTLLEAILVTARCTVCYIMYR